MEEGEMVDLGFAPLMSIAVICYLIATALKLTPLDKKWLPLICGVCGGMLGYVGMFIIENYPATDPLTSVAIGIVSGLSATGFHQRGKQLVSKNGGL